MSGVPTVYSALAQVPVDADIGSLRYVLVGAAPLPPSVAKGSAPIPESPCAKGTV